MRRRAIFRCSAIFLTCTFLQLTFTQSISAAITNTYPVQQYELEKKLKRLGLPTGQVDGVFDQHTRRALCIWRELTNRYISRQLPADDEYSAVQDTDILFPLPSFVVGMNINRTCQSAIFYQIQPQYVLKIFRVSTGMPGFESNLGLWSVKWRINDWYLSTQFPDGWMYRPMFFNAGEAIHGSLSDAMVHTYPASHGCVRMFQRDIDYLWSHGFKSSSLVYVYGRWRG